MVLELWFFANFWCGVCGFFVDLIGIGVSSRNVVELVEIVVH